MPTTRLRLQRHSGGKADDYTDSIPSHKSYRLCQAAAYRRKNESPTKAYAYSSTKISTLRLRSHLAVYKGVRSHVNCGYRLGYKEQSQKLWNETTEQGSLTEQRSQGTKLIAPLNRRAKTFRFWSKYAWLC